jgi:hypothetical protein
MAYRARFSAGKGSRIEKYATAREANEAVDKFNAQHGIGAEYIGKSPRKLDRSTVTFQPARRRPNGISVTAMFKAPKTTSGVGEYHVTLSIDPSTRGVLSAVFTLLNRKGGSQVDQFPTDQHEIARE